MSPLMILAAVAVLAVLALALSRPFLAKTARRHLVRRPARTLTMAAGTALSVALVTATLGLGDSLDASSRAAVSRDFGQMTATVSGHFTAAQGRAAQDWLAARPGVTAATAFARGSATLTVTSTRTALSRQSVSALGVDAGFESAFGPMHTAAGAPFDVGALTTGQVAVSASLAHTFDVRPGDRLVLDFFGQTKTVTVAATLNSDIATTSSDLLFGGLAQIVMPMVGYAALTDSGGALTTLAYRAPRLSAAAAGNLAAAVRVHFGIPASPSAPSPGAHGSGEQPLSAAGPQLTLASQAQAAAGRASFLGALGSQEYRQLSELLPSLAVLLIGCGIALLLLMVLLLAAERRTESGMSRAIGMSALSLAGAHLIEALAYTGMALVIGLPAGIALIRLKIGQLSRLPLSTPFGGGFHLPLSASISGHSLLTVAAAFTCLIAAVTLAVEALAMHEDIVASVRGVPNPPRLRPAFPQLCRALLSSSSAHPASGDPAGDRYAPGTGITRAQAARGLIGSATRCGLLPALGAAGCLVTAARLQDEWQALVPPRLRSAVTFDAFWIQQSGVLLGILAAGLAAASLLRACRLPASLASRCGLTLAAVCALVYGLQPDGTVFGLFQPPGSSFLVSANAATSTGRSGAWSLVTSCSSAARSRWWWATSTSSPRHCA
jgi:ABC-type lipoprotein release transport system permease subunit